MMEPIELSAQVLVIGGGLAATCAARVASSFCPDVLVVCKGPFGLSGSSPRRVSGFSHQETGLPFRGNPVVLLDAYVLDILETGQLINDQHIVDQVTEDANDHYSWSEWFGFRGRARDAAAAGQPALGGECCGSSAGP